MQAPFAIESVRSRIRRGDAIALGLALAVHAVLLSLPLHHWQEGPSTHGIAVSLVRPVSQAPASVEPPPSEPPHTKAEPRTDIPVPAETVQPRPAAPVAPEPEAAAEDATRTVARLIEQLRQHGNPAAEESSRRRLGEFIPQPPPRNWRSGLWTEWDRSGGTPLPDRVEIVDRWLAADGSHNVIVETPTGERLCGRAEAWNPISPLVEPVMMFQTCGSGKPTFEMDRPYRDR